MLIVNILLYYVLSTSIVPTARFKCTFRYLTFEVYRPILMSYNVLGSLSTARERNPCTVRLDTMYNNYYVFRNDITQLELAHLLVDAFNMDRSEKRPCGKKTKLLENFKHVHIGSGGALIAISKLIPVSENRRSRSYYYYPHRFSVYTSQSSE